MALKNIFRRNAPVDTGPHRSAPVDTGVAQVDTGAQQVTPLEPAEPEWRPMVFGTLHTPPERAVLLIEALIADGYEGKPVLQDDMHEYHCILCGKHGWAPVSWLAICRALGPKGLKLRKGYWRIDGERLTTYVIARPQTTNVVHLACNQLKG